jgi:dual specificity tyrosine-phosphorylation-regulated kinase 2/3/4
MASAASLASQTSLSSANALSPTSHGPSQTPDRHYSSSRPGTASSANHQAGTLAPQHAPLSPSNSMRRGASKRLTPSSIPFFRRSSSQSMQAAANGAAAVSPTSALTLQLPVPKDKERTSPVDSSLSTPASAHKKSSIISLGALLKGSSSKRNLHSGDTTDHGGRSDKEGRRTDKEDGGLRPKKDEKDRSESRISVLMGRRRGKVRLRAPFALALRPRRFVAPGLFLGADARLIRLSDCVVRRPEEAATCESATDADCRAPAIDRSTAREYED